MVAENQSRYQIKYPRKTLLRCLLRALGRAILPLAARAEINGQKHFPDHGPVILAGNHVAIMEVVLMVVYAPYIVELLGTGDIPIDPDFAPIANAYGFIPINRGNVDRRGLKSALEVLKQGGVLGIFPEGGIWNPSEMKAQTGIAWLSNQAQAPIIPIGFGGMQGALAATLKLKRPHLTMNIGEPIPPIQISHPELSHKQALELSSSKILDRINELVPEEEFKKRPEKINERYDLRIYILDRNQAQVEIPEDYSFDNASSLAKLLHQPVLLDVFIRNLHMITVKPLAHLNQTNDPAGIAQACTAILNYLSENPGFLTYRFGIDEGVNMQKGLSEMAELANWAAKSGFSLFLEPVYRYRILGQDQEVILNAGGSPPKM